MNTLERILELIQEGRRTPEEIAGELGLRKDEVEAAIEMLKALGYIEEVHKGSPACETCPLRKVCGGKCFMPVGGGRIKVMKVKVKGGNRSGSHRR
ncbi:DNA-binding protein [Thermococcus sp.]|uniref:DNA-binding protein n=1 Tax=Thermococcus sp. TaxID=35749 RepID=UPI0026379EC5|nr:DNA-binding protein [Thermococcus sp.]